MRDRTRFDLADGLVLAGTAIQEVWWRYTAFGGQADLDLLAERIAGTAECTDGEHDLIAQVLNEIFYDNGIETFPVGYHEHYRPLPITPLPEPSRADNSAGRRAAEARRRSAGAARQAAELHLTAARLMRDSGQLRLAGRAHIRAFAAFSRSRLPS